MAARTRASSWENDAFMATMTVSAPTTDAATSAPSSTRYGLRRRMARSLNVPGSPSAALTTTVAASCSDLLSKTVRHLVPVGKPAPPRPRSPDASRAPITPSGSALPASWRACPPPAAEVVVEGPDGGGIEDAGMLGHAPLLP